LLILLYLAMDQKTCIKCNVNKPYSEFYKHNMMADGHLNKCKDCTKRDVREREKKLSNDPDWVNKELERQRIKSARARFLFKAVNKDKKKKYISSWIKKNQEKKKAHAKVSNAIKTGKLTRKPCEICGEMKVQAHHEDYSKPLEVNWLCSKHHGERHVEINKLKRTFD
jgi:hypothetical protein